MTTPQVEEPKQANTPAEEQEQDVAAVEAPLSPEEIAARTAGGVMRWLFGTVITFWLAIIGVPLGVLRDSVLTRNISLLLLFVTLITTVILYFSVMLEPATFTFRRVKIALGLSFGDLGVLTLICLAIRIYAMPGGPHFTILSVLAVLPIFAAVAVLVYAFRKDQRFLFMAAIAILLASNLIPVGK
ncbi:MAG: hypothetical protein ACYDCO_08595 [Armatimonadota bacterium]